MKGSRVYSDFVDVMRADSITTEPARELLDSRSWGASRFDLDDHLVHCQSELVGALMYFMLGRYGDARALLERCAAPLERRLPGTWIIPILRLLEGLTAAAILGDADADLAGRERRRLRRTLNSRRRGLRRLASRGCAFDLHATLLEAEAHAIAERREDAMQAFERARALGAAQQNLLMEGICSERMAVVAERWGLTTWLHGAVASAHDRYSVWGAAAKAAQLRERWPWLSAAASRSPQM